MFAFQITHDDDAKLIIAKNAHLKTEEHFAMFTASSDTGIIVSISGCTIRQLQDAGIAFEIEPGVNRLANLTDDSAEAQAIIWGDIVRHHFCGCLTDPVEPVFFERYNDAGVYTGLHGWACPTCKGIVQIG